MYESIYMRAYFFEMFDTVCQLSMKYRLIVVVLINSNVVEQLKSNKQVHHKRSVDLNFGFLLFFIDSFTAEKKEIEVASPRKLIYL